MEKCIFLVILLSVCLMGMSHTLLGAKESKSSLHNCKIKLLMNLGNNVWKSFKLSKGSAHLIMTDEKATSGIQF